MVALGESDHATAADLHPRRPSWVPCAQLVARQPNLTSVGIGAPVLVEPIEISEPPGIVTVWVLVHPVLPGGTVQLSAVLALPTRTVNVRVSVGPVATVSVTARSRAVIVAFAVNELTLFSLASAANWPEGARNEVPAGTLTPRPSSAPKAGLPSAPRAPCAPVAPRGPCAPCAPRGPVRPRNPRGPRLPCLALVFLAAAA